MDVSGTAIGGSGASVEIKMNKKQRWYALHREEELARAREEYNSRPDVIAKREERERKKAEKEALLQAEKERKRIEREERNREKNKEKLALAMATSKKKKVDPKPVED